MALRLRRGTDAQRGTITPAEGELIYTTDTKKIYAGDGSSVGGNIVSGINNVLEDVTPQLGGTLDTNSQNIQGVGNIDITGTITASGTITATNFVGDYKGSIVGDDSSILVDAVNSKITGVVDTSSVTATSIAGTLTGTVNGTLNGSVNGTLTGDITGSVFADDSTAMVDAQNKRFTGDLTGNVTGNVTGTLTGVMSGSVFDDASTLLVDGINGKIVGDIKSPLIEAFTTTTDKPEVAIKGEQTYGSLDFKRGDGTGDLRSGASNAYGQIKFYANDSNGDAYNVYMQGGNKGFKIFLLEDFATFETEKSFIFENTGKFGIGTQTPAAKVDISGEILLGRLDQTAIDALTAVNGMMVYNTTTNKFQGYENGAWVNLV